MNLHNTHKHTQYLVARNLNPCDKVSGVSRGGQRARAGENLIDRAAVDASRRSHAVTLRKPAVNLGQVGTWQEIAKLSIRIQVESGKIRSGQVRALHVCIQ